MDDQFKTGKWVKLWGCHKCKIYGDPIDIGRVCGECGTSTWSCVVRPIYEVTPWYRPNRFIGYERK